MNHRYQWAPRKLVGGNTSLVLALFIAMTAAQSVVVEAGAHAATEITEHVATEGSTKPYPYPPMNANVLSGNALVTALRAGGYVLFMRHTETGKLTLECIVGNLTPCGERDAARNTLVATILTKGKDVLRVSHMQSGSTTFDMNDLDVGEIIVYRPDSIGARPIASIRADDWYKLANVAANSSTLK